MIKRSFTLLFVLLLAFNLYEWTSVGMEIESIVHAQGKVKATATAHSVTISWTASTTAGVSYTVYRASSASGPFTGNTGITDVKWTDTAVTPGASYFYQVTAVCTAACPAGITGESPPSNQIAVVVPNPQPPASPTNLKLGSVTVVVVSP